VQAPKIPVTLCIDIEPDERSVEPGHVPPWTGFEDLHAYLSRQRPLLEKATGSPVHFCWLLRLDPQIQHAYGTPDWPVQRYRHLLDTLRAAGDEIGLHTHAWRWDDAWVADHGDPRWVEHCVRLSARIYRASFGCGPKVFRFGDRFLSNRVVSLLERLGVVCDLTVEPGQPCQDALDPRQRHTGRIPDYTAVPRRPYRPSRWNYQRPGRWLARRLWLMPLSTGRPRGPIHGLPDPVPHCLTLVLGFPFPAVQQIVEACLHAHSRPYLAAVARTDVRLDPFNREQFDQALHFLAEHPLRERFVLETPRQALPRLVGSFAPAGHSSCR
jgi:hypothetical protein